MAELLRPQTAERDLRTALAAVEAAYERLMAAPRPEPHLLLDLRSRARELTDAAVKPLNGVPHGRPARIRHRCAGADRGARWIMQHFH